MTNSYFLHTETWRIPETVIPDSLAEMAIDGKHGNEGLVLWLGRDYGEIAEVTHLVRLRGSFVQKHPDFINIHASLLNDVADLAIHQKARLIGQVHSHGSGYWLDLSQTDREYGIKAPYFLSLVAPDYGCTTAPIQQWGVNVFAEGVGYVRLSPEQVRRRLQIVPGPHLPFLTAGGER
jgi:hypothetical protein